MLLRKFGIFPKSRRGQTNWEMQNDPNDKFHDEYCKIKIKNLLLILNKEHLGYIRWKCELT